MLSKYLECRGSQLTARSVHVCAGIAGTRPKQFDVRNNCAKGCAYTLGCECLHLVSLCTATRHCKQERGITC